MATRYDNAIERQEAQRAVIAAMLTLGDDKLLCLYFRYHCGLTLERTGELLDIPTDRARRLEALALRELSHPRIAKRLRQYL